MEEESESVRVKDIILKRKIGNGSFSVVWRAEHRGTGEEVAVKQVFLSKLNLRLKSSFHCELNFLSSVNHPNIVRLLDFFQLEHPIMTQNLMNKRSTQLKEWHILNLTRIVSCALFPRFRLIWLLLLMGAEFWDLEIGVHGNGNPLGSLI
ncbi:hypothetical protein Ahy_A02g007171 [Arachis hypogaea]|uniref:Protein kinase domain-containing protein n=1 Tax=Arachis hypogaea TaxID=3818 RepID=A0A445EBT3_ARAHY|nr:hypothetical protein Ahy_A02g007171 [Arachis hypogaea]